jgi:CheY-like chemotaxis protein
MSSQIIARPIEILLVEDSPGDARLTIEALKENNVWNNLHTVENGQDALAWLRREGKYSDAPRPDIILLDLNMPKKDGRHTLAEIKEDEYLKHIPVVVLTTSREQEDILQVYSLNANCYVTKPLDFEQFKRVVKSVAEFWLTVVKLPSE